jgi:hypothetical protein
MVTPEPGSGFDRALPQRPERRDAPHGRDGSHAGRRSFLSFGQERGFGIGIQHTGELGLQVLLFALPKS